MNTYYVYMLTNKTKSVLYIGVTNNISRRIYKHKNKLTPGFTSKYNCHYLIYAEQTSSIGDALIREKQLKGQTRKKKEDLINISNPDWEEITL